MDDFKNANNRSINYYLNAIKLFNYSYFANAVVFASELPSVAITELKFNKPSTSIEAGKTEKVGVVTTPFNATTPIITYSSSDSSVATVLADENNGQNCVITAVAEGTATITATAGNVTTTMSVTVTETETETE